MFVYNVICTSTTQTRSKVKRRQGGTHREGIIFGCMVVKMRSKSLGRINFEVFCSSWHRVAACENVLFGRICFIIWECYVSLYAANQY